jgi:hypothetical protein
MIYLLEDKGEHVPRSSLCPFSCCPQGCVRCQSMLTIDRLIDRQPDNGEEASYHEGTAQQFVVAEKTAATTTWGRWLSSHLVAVQTEVPQTYERTHRDSRALELCAGIGVITCELEVYFCIAMAALQLLRCGKFLLPRSWKLLLLLLRC